MKEGQQRESICMGPRSFPQYISDDHGDDVMMIIIFLILKTVAIIIYKTIF